MEQSSKRPLLNIVNFVGNALSPLQAVADVEARKGALIQSRPVRHIAESLLSSGKFLFDRGQWFVDARYVVTNDFKMWFHDQHDLPEDKITIFRVAPHVTDYKSQNSKYTSATDNHHIQHGGLWYVGHEVQMLLNALPHKALELYEKHLSYSNYEVSRRRYPYPVRIIRSKYDVYRNHLHDMAVLYKNWGLDISAHNTDESIRATHQQILASKPETPFLILDSDFEPNGDPSLMYEPQGDETKYVHLWFTSNRVNNATYGHGSPKLMSFSNMDFSVPGADMTTSCAKHGLKIHKHVVGLHGFDQSVEGVWRTTFREVFKLSQSEGVQAWSLVQEWKTPSPHLVGEMLVAYVDAVNTALAMSESEVTLVNDYEALNNLFNERQATWQSA